MRTRKQKSTFKNISETITLLIDMYYYRRRLMKRWRSIKRYQRTGIIGYKPSGLPISKNPPPPIHSKSKYLKSTVNDLVVPEYISAAENAVKNKLVNSKEDYYQMLIRRQVEPKQNRRLSDDILLYLNNIGADIQYINDIRYNTFKFRIEYKNHIKELEFTNTQTDVHINQIIRNNILYIERQVYSESLKLEKEKEKEKLAIKNNPHNLEVGNQYYINYKLNDCNNHNNYNLIKITRITDNGYPWAIGVLRNGIIYPNTYDIKTIDGKWIHNCKQWDDFQAKKRLNKGYELSELDKKHLKDKGVVYQFWLSHEKGKHSSLRIYYKSRVNLHIFYNKPLRIDVFNTIQSYMNQIDQEESVALRRKQLEESNNYISYIRSSPGIDIHNPLRFAETKIQQPW